MTWVAVDVQADHLEQLARGESITGIIELVWNAIDADATQIHVSVPRDALGAVLEVRVEDNGHGMSQDEAIEGFSHLGGSWKRQAERSKSGSRILHGQDGKGRWKAFTLGPEVIWSTVAEENSRREQVTITGHRQRLNGFEISEPTLTHDSCGTLVRATAEQPGPTDLLDDEALKTLTATFALYLRMYPTIEIKYRNILLDPADLETCRADYPLQLADNQNGHAVLTVIEWSDQVAVKRGLFLCDSSGTTLADLKAGIQAKGYEFTAYIRWNGFREMEDRLLLAEGDSAIAPVIELARDQLRMHFENRRRESIREVVQDWKNEEVYPYEVDPADEHEAIKRNLFDVVAVQAAEAVNSSKDNVSRRLSLRLLREALESNPTTLRRVLDEVLQLPRDSLDELNRLLDHTTLAKIVAASSMISNRLDFVESLSLLVFDPTSKSRIKERSQLHRILADETWIFGEEFALAADDQTLTSALKAHIKLLGRVELSKPEPVVDESGKERVVDLLLARKIPQSQDRMEHLVVELKAPRVKIGADEITQIEKYAFAVAGDSRFEMTDVHWNFIVISSDLTDHAKQKASQSQRKPGLVHEDGTIHIWVKTWAQVIGESKHRHKFVQEALQYAPGAEEALSYLREVHSKYLPETLSSSSINDDDPAGE